MLLHDRCERYDAPTVYARQTGQLLPQRGMHCEFWIGPGCNQPAPGTQVQAAVRVTVRGKLKKRKGRNAAVFW